MDKLLEKYIKDSIEIQRGTYQAGYQIGYKKGFEAGKRADLEKEMAERVGSNGETKEELKR